MTICQVCGADYEGDECPECREANRPFYRKNLKREGEDKLLLTLRLNAEERQALDDIKSILDISSDGGALKIVAFRGWDVLQRTLGRDNLKWLCSKDRQSRGLK